MILLGLGSNIGDRLKHLREAVARLKQDDMLTSVRYSAIYESDAMIDDQAPASWNMPFLNMVVAGKSRLKAYGILDKVKQIEREMGRQPTHERWAPRPIDIDILLVDSQRIDEERLTVPHPGILQRAFVFEPLAELLPDWQPDQNGLSLVERIKKGLPSCVTVKKTSYRVEGAL
jgi:2-amino-4-hydroxy-6-hydroxymethyldihydropteridine diphosphokinase